jgi:hypothetical protein
MAHTKLGIINDKNIPMSKSLNRTSMFAPIQKKYFNKTTEQSHSLLFKDRYYKLSIYGNQLNHTYDYPLLALIIKHWLNSRVKNQESNTVKVLMSEIYDVFNFTFDKTKNKNYNPIASSIERLHGANMRLENKQIKIKEWSSLINNPKMSYGEFGYIEVEIGNILKKLYETIFSIEHLYSSFIDINKLIAAPSENSKALMKFFMSQSNSYVDFKVELLSKILGYDNRQLTAAKKREYIKKALNELVGTGFLITFETRDADQLKKLEQWIQVRIISSNLTGDKSEANKLLESLESNFKGIKNHHRLNKIEKEMDDERPF